MKCLIMIPALFALIQAHPRLAGNQPNDIQTTRGSRVVGGSVAKLGDFPFMAAVIVEDNFYCGGSLIAPQWVLTAAHCTKNMKSLTVVLGSVDLNDDDKNEIVQVTNHIEHENYTVAIGPGDIALLQLKQEVTLNDFIKTIPLADEDYNFLENPAKALGWGRTSDDNEAPSNTLMHVNLTVISNTQCRKTFGYFIQNYHTCTQDAKEKGLCLGDSGGPLIDQCGVQFGIFSFMGSKCESGAPFVFVRVASYITWIKEKTGLDDISTNCPNTTENYSSV